MGESAIAICKACGMPMRVMFDDDGNIEKVFAVCKCDRESSDDSVETHESVGGNRSEETQMPDGIDWNSDKIRVMLLDDDRLASYDRAMKSIRREEDMIAVIEELTYFAVGFVLGLVVGGVWAWVWKRTW